MLNWKHKNESENTFWRGGHVLDDTQKTKSQNTIKTVLTVKTFNNVCCFYFLSIFFFVNVIYFCCLFFITYLHLHGLQGVHTSFSIFFSKTWAQNGSHYEFFEEQKEIIKLQFPTFQRSPYLCSNYQYMSS